MHRSKVRFLSGRPEGGATYNPQQIRDHLHAFQRSGLSAAAFARQQGLSYYRFRSWLPRTPQRASIASRPQFQSVPLSSVLGQTWAAEVVSPTGMTVRLSAQVPPSLGLELVALSCRL